MCHALFDPGEPTGSTCLLFSFIWPCYRFSFFYLFFSFYFFIVIFGCYKLLLLKTNKPNKWTVRPRREFMSGSSGLETALPSNTRKVFPCGIRSAAHTCHRVRAWRIQQTGCSETECWGPWWSRQLQGSYADALETRKSCSGKCSPRRFRRFTPDLPTTSSRTSFHSTSPPDSWTMVTATLLWRPCRANAVNWNVTPVDMCSESAVRDLLTWCSRNVPWHGMPCLWSTTAGM